MTYREQNPEDEETEELRKRLIREAEKLAKRAERLRKSITERK